jgi:hypothetical protein
VGPPHEAYDTGDTDAPAMPQLRLAAGVSPEAVNWPDLGILFQIQKFLANSSYHAGHIKALPATTLSRRRPVPSRRR